MLLRPDLNAPLKTGMRKDLPVHTRKTLQQNKKPSLPGRGSVGQKNKFEQFFKAGSLIYIEGDPGRDMFIIKSGKVKILKQEGTHTIILAILGPGSVLGELSLLDNMPRTATVMALDDVTALKIDQTVLSSTMQKLPPWFALIIKTVVSRLRTTMLKNSTDLVKNNVKGIVEIFLYMIGDGIADKNNEICLALSELKEKAHYIIGLSGKDTDKVINELILSSLILLKKDEKNKQRIVIQDLNILKLFSEYLTSKFYSKPFLCENISKNAVNFIKLLEKIGPEKGIKDRDGMLVMSRPSIEVEMERAGMGRYIDHDVLDELTEQNAIVVDKSSTKTGNMHTKTIKVKFSLSTIKKVTNIIEWMPVFKDE